MAPPVTQRVTKGQRIGRGIVISPEIRISKNGRRGARLMCDCGSIYEVPVSRLFPNSHGFINTLSCGCLSRESKAGNQRNLKHGLTGHPLRAAWYMMLDRCYNPNNEAYKRYGGRGISVYGRWHDVRIFIQDIERELGARPLGMSLDRINNDGDYEPGNVRWATRQQQSLNSIKSANNSSGHIGVNKLKNRWYGLLVVNGERHHLGGFDTFEDAVNAYHAAVSEYLSETPVPCCHQYVSKSDYPLTKEEPT